MRHVVSALAAGLVFGLGLAVSGMTQADKVIAFLDPLGGWDPSLALVMVGAIGVHAVLFRLILRRGSPLLAPSFAVPTRRDLTPRLVGGAALFGAGWGLAGYCPGPGLVASVSGDPAPLVFLATLTLGMVGVHAWEAAQVREPEGAVSS